MSINFLQVVCLSSILLATACDQEEAQPAPGDFAQVLPGNDAENVSATPVFEWNEAPNATTYRLTVSRRNDFGEPVIDLPGLTETTLAINTPLAAGTKYFWKVTAEGGGTTTVASNAGSFFRIAASPVGPSPGIHKYFVSPSGEDNPGKGTAAEPFQTLAYAASQVPAAEGDTIFLNPGTYIETKAAAIAVGVHVIGSGEGSTILSSTGVKIPPGVNTNDTRFKLWYDGSLIQLVSPQRAVFRDVNSTAIAPADGNQTLAHFTIDGNNKSLKAGVWVENRNNVTMHHVTIRNCAQRGAVFAPGAKDFYTYPAYYMTGTLIHDCTFINSAKDLDDESLGNLCLAQLDGAEVHHVTIQETEGYGIKFIYDGYFKHVNIHDCTIDVNEADAKWGEDISIELWNLGPGNIISNINCNTWLSVVNHPEMFGNPVETENLHIDHVRIVDRDGVSSKEAIEVGMPGVEVSESYFENKGFGLALWDMGRGNIVIRNNIFFNTVEKNNWASGAAIYIDNSRTWDFRNIRIFNNVFDTHRVAVKLKGARIHDVFIRNNVFLNASLWEVEAEGSNIVATHNLKYAANGETAWFTTGLTAQSDNIGGDPGFLKSGERWNTYYKPASATSAVVDKGVDVGLPFSGAAPDMGRWEYP